ncbi:MAG: hypothetical protein HC819_00340 [Cyclobacteriaceae bacterium]|nr:hypothetical protein [Cyclobacteriaceae bacterium]
MLHLLMGIATAHIGTVLIYFKQKPLLHHGSVFVLLVIVYFFGFVWRWHTSHIRVKWQMIALLIISAISITAPLFLYQIRPFTFYVSGIALLLVSVLATAGQLFSHTGKTGFLGNIGALAVGVVLGFGLPFEVGRYILWALALFIVFFFLVYTRPGIQYLAIVSIFLLAIFFGYRKYHTPIVWFEEQVNYEDKIVYSANTQFHKLVVTRWHHDYWFFIDQLKNLSSIDEFLYYEPMVHSLFTISQHQKKALVLGGENGCLLREVLKYPQITSIEVLSYDTLLRNIAIENPFFTRINNYAYANEKVRTIHKDLLSYLAESTDQYDLIFVDLPDPRSVETNQYYTIEFFALVGKMLTDGGVMITQAGSPYFATDAFVSIGHTLQRAGFYTLPIHNQILTLGEWGWYICSFDQNENKMQQRLVNTGKLPVDTRWYNREAASLISSFGKTNHDTSAVQINTIANPVVYRYYLQGNWELN